MVKNTFNKLNQLGSSFSIKLRKMDLFDLLTLASIISYGVIFSYFTIQKHNNFGSYADLAVFIQACHTTIFDGKLFYYTYELWLNLSGLYFGVHFSPILFLILPVYAVFPSALSLLIFQSFLLALGALPLYMLSARLLKSKSIAFILVITYLLYPALHGANWFDFHPQAFIPFLVLSAHYFATKESWKIYTIFVILALMIEEHMPYIMILLAICYLMDGRLRGTLNWLMHIKSFKYTGLLKNLKRIDKTSMSILTIIICISWIMLTRSVKSLFPVNPLFLNIYRTIGQFYILGFKEDILLLPIYVILNPQNVLNALMFDFQIKFLTFIVLFGPLLFTPLRSKFVLPPLAILFSMFVSNYIPYYSIGNQYALYVVPLLFIAAVHTLSAFGTMESNKTRLVNRCESSVKKVTPPQRNLAKLMVAVSMIFVISISPLSPFAYKISQEGLLWYPSPLHLNPPKFVESLHALITLIPDDDSVLTCNYILPHVSSRPNAYLIPFDLAEYRSGEKKAYMENYVMQILNDTEYVLIDLGYPDYWSEFVFGKMSDAHFGVYAVTYSFVLYKKNYDGQFYFVPHADSEVFISSRDMNIDVGKLVADKSSKSGYVAFSEKGVDSGILVYGPYLCLPAGTYNVTYEIKVTDYEKGLVVSFDVASDAARNIIAQKGLYSDQVSTQGWFKVSLVFSVDKFTTNVEFRMITTGSANIYVDRVILSILR